MTTEHAIVVAKLGWVGATGLATTGAYLAGNQGEVGVFVMALWALALAIALGVLALIRATLKSINDPLSKQVPIIAAAYTQRLLNRWRLRAGLKPLPISDDDDGESDSGR